MINDTDNTSIRILKHVSANPGTTREEIAAACEGHRIQASTINAKLSTLVEIGALTFPRREGSRAPRRFHLPEKFEFIVKPKPAPSPKDVFYGNHMPN